MKFTINQIVSVTGGRLLNNATPDAGSVATPNAASVGARFVQGASIDSREIGPGQLFVPIVAERDGHDFVSAAIASGAGAVLWSRDQVGPTQTESPQVEAGSTPIIYVADTMVALSSLGAAAADRLHRAGATVVGITGSVGKTSVKDLTRAALSSLRCHANERSFNNEMGVPLTLLQAPDDTQVAVIEMGARGPGHIAELCAIARPDIGVVTMVGAVHTSEFGTVEAVARAKAELVQAIEVDGTAILNADCGPVAAMASQAAGHVLTYGSTGQLRARDVVLDDDLQPRFIVETPQGSASVELAVSGHHQVSNALAALAVATAVGVDLRTAAEGLGGAQLSPWRMEMLRTPSGALVINDAYNANALSMVAALDALASAAATRRVAVLGTMAELGERHDLDHRDVAAYASRLGIAVISLNEPAYGVAQVESVEEAAVALGELTDTDAVLVKGSRVAGLETLAARLVGTEVT